LAFAGQSDIDSRSSLQFCKIKKAGRAVSLPT
jgi:hypothetical protein